MALTKLQLRTCTIERGRVLSVDTRNYVCTVATEFTQKPLSGVTWTSLYEHYENGEGVYVMPEVGSIAWIVFPSDSSMPFIIGWTTVEDPSGSHRSHKMDLNPGDIYLGTRDENRIILRRGGVIQIGATPLAQRLYLPINNIIKDLCENYSLQTLAGSLEWSVGISAEDKDGKRPTKVVLHAREKADDAKPIATLQIGSHSEGDPTILSLVVRDTGALGQKPQITLKLTKAGDATWDLKGTMTVTTDKDLTFHSNTKLTLQGDAEVHIDGGKVTVGAATYPVALDSPDLETWIAAVSLMLNTTGPVIGAPLSVIKPIAHVSKKMTSS